MSGGSYDYLCYADYEEIIMRIETLEKMRDDMLKDGYEDIAKIITNYIFHIKKAKITMEIYHKNLYDVLHAYEWWKSGDFGQEQFEKAVKEWKSKSI